jgi:hypothetical protein
MGRFGWTEGTSDRKSRVRVERSGKSVEYVLQHICAQHALSPTVQIYFEIRAIALSPKVFSTLSPKAYISMQTGR